MAGYSNFKTSRAKHSKTVNVFKRGNNRSKEKPKSSKLMDGVDVWTSFYRANPHRFVKDYLGIELKLFQQILLYAMMHFHYLAYIAARGQGKTFLTAIFCVTRAILYPSTKIIVAAGQKTQSREVIGKIEELKIDSPMLRRELSDLKSGSNDPRAEFHNGSWIRVVAANDGARGQRSNLLIVDEYRMVPETIINSVLRKFQSAPRFVGFMNKPEYKDKDEYKERNKQIFLSSAWYKAHESWDRVVSYNQAMLDHKSYFVCSLPYQVSIKEGLLMRDDVQDEMSEKNFNEIMWEMEMNAQFWGSNLNSFFTYEELQKNRKLTKVFYPRNVHELFTEKKLKPPKKETGELRVVSADIATMAGSDNDASAFTVARLIPTKDGYERQIVYLESIDGGHTTAQAMRIRQLYADFDCDYIVLDTQNAGIGVYDKLTEHANDPETGEAYEPLSCLNDERLADRCVYRNAPKVIYSIRASLQLNSEIAAGFKDSLRRGKIKLPVLEGESDDLLSTVKDFKDMPTELKTLLKLPYIHTTLMVNEILNLETEITDNGQIRLKETKKNRKDRYSSISYLNHFVSDYLEIKNRKKTTTFDPSALFMVKTPTQY